MVLLASILSCCASLGSIVYAAACSPIVVQHHALVFVFVSIVQLIIHDLVVRVACLTGGTFGSYHG